MLSAMAVLFYLGPKEMKMWLFHVGKLYAGESLTPVITPTSIPPAPDPINK